ncbi:MAG: hypothetical protein IKC64_01325 [Clostridia bacterium]|nr:hypothetical protein [Clostridia bacterium]
MISQSDKTRIRELAKKYMEIACSTRQVNATARFKATNDLKIVRPPVLIDEIPWYQLNADGELTCVCENERARRLEFFFLTALYRWAHFDADTNFEPFYRVVTAIDSTGIGVSVNDTVVRTDDTNNIVSHSYEDILQDESALDLIKIPRFTLRPDIDENNMNFFTELLGDTMPVKLCGRGYIYHAPWDFIARLRGVESIFYDFYDRPEYLHAIRKRFMDITNAELDFVEKYSFVDDGVPDIHCTPGQVSGLSGKGWKATWFRTMAQNFSEISPQMHEEFELDYIEQMSNRFAYTYYGCCEPLDNKIEILKKRIKNLRKIGVSPWADINACAEQIGGDFVFARKPNPAHVAISTSPETIYKETEQTVKACIKYNCPCEFVLKDISTVSHKPQNLIVWAKTVSQVLDKYFDKK